MKMIKTDKLVFEYAKRDEEGNIIGKSRAIDEVTLDIEPGQFIAILGHNGSGKSTLAKHMNALLVPSDGTMWVDGMDTKEEEHLWDVRQSAGMVFQNPDNQIIGTVVEEDVGFGPENLGVPTEEIWQRVGKDPSGQPFNSLLQLEIEQGKPRNPFINAGALVVCDMLQSRLSAPRQRMLEIVRRLSGVADIAYDPVVARSEFEHSARNAAIAWLMKSFGNFHNDVATVLQNYFHYCSLEMSCVELARTFLFLADRGIAPHLDAPVIAPIQSRQVNALMMTSGMYQNAGEFAWRVGLPAKSGVGGGIVAIVPQEMAIAVWSPELDDAGNSLAGVAMLEKLTQRMGRSVF